MLSKNKIKYIRSLELKKKRKEEQVFVAEAIYWDTSLASY